MSFLILLESKQDVFWWGSLKMHILIVIANILIFALEFFSDTSSVHGKCVLLEVTWLAYTNSDCYYVILWF